MLHANAASHACELPKKTLSQMFVGTVLHKSSIDMNLLFMLLQITLIFFYYFELRKDFSEALLDVFFCGFLCCFWGWDGLDVVVCLIVHKICELPLII